MPESGPDDSRSDNAPNSEFSEESSDYSSDSIEVIGCDPGPSRLPSRRRRQSDRKGGRALAAEPSSPPHPSTSHWSTPQRSLQLGLGPVKEAKAKQHFPFSLNQRQPGAKVVGPSSSLSPSSSSISSHLEEQAQRERQEAELQELRSKVISQLALKKKATELKSTSVAEKPLSISPDWASASKDPSRTSSKEQIVLPPTPTSITHDKAVGESFDRTVAPDSQTSRPPDPLHTSHNFPTAHASGSAEARRRASLTLEILKGTVPRRRHKCGFSPPLTKAELHERAQYTLPELAMAPTRQQPLLKERFVLYFSRLKTSTYTDTPPSRNPLPSHAIRTLAWNALGTLVATGAADRTLRIWNPERTNMKYSTELRGHSGAVEKVEFNPKHESELASCGSDGTVRLWDVRKKDCIREIKPNTSRGIDLLTWRPDGEEILVGTKATSTESPSTLMSISRDTLTATPIPCETPISSISFTHSTVQPTLLLASTSGTLTMHSYPDLAPLHTLRAHSSPLLSHALSPPATLLATGGSDALITLWDTHDWVCVRKLDHCIGPITSVTFSFDGSYVVGGSDEGTGLEIAHAETGEYVHTVETTAPSMCVQWHPSRYVLAYSAEIGLKIVGGMG